MSNYRYLLFVIGMVIGCGAAMGQNDEKSFTVVDYDRMLFSNGEYTTLMSRYKLSDTVVMNSMQDGFGLLCGNVYVRDAMRELCGIDSLEKAHIWSNVLDYPHLIIPSLNVDQIIVDGTFNLDVPTGRYDIVLILDGFYPIHLKWEIKNQHKYSFLVYIHIEHTTIG